jgi:hypothetical protein
MALGESWFSLDMGDELMSLQPDHEILEREWHTIQSEK